MQSNILLNIDLKKINGGPAGGKADARPPTALGSDRDAFTASQAIHNDSATTQEVGESTYGIVEANVIERKDEDDDGL